MAASVSCSTFAQLSFSKNLGDGHVHQRSRVARATATPEERAHSQSSSHVVHKPRPLDADHWNVKLTLDVLQCGDPVRSLVESISLAHAGDVEENKKAVISLGLGDPGSLDEVYKVPQEAVDALLRAISSNSFNGYTLSAGSLDCRRAVASYLSADLPSPMAPEDIFITPGCSQALMYCISVLAKKGCNMLLPRPTFPVYEGMCKFYGVQCRWYDLLPERGWEADLHGMETLADSNTTAIIVCNPSNPCGSVYSYRHLEEITMVAKKLKLPIITDEIYGKMVFGHNKFVPMATFASNAPVFTVGGLSKRWFAPGWRLGWACVSDPTRIFKRAGLLKALSNVAQLNLGASSIIQAAIPSILANTPEAFFSRVLDSLARASKLCYLRALEIDGVSCPWQPQGAMYAMVRIHIGKLNDVDFAEALLKEENVLVVPGTAFGAPNWVRLQLAVPLSTLEEAWNRIESFCQRHQASRLSSAQHEDVSTAMVSI